MAEWSMHVYGAVGRNSGQTKWVFGLIREGSPLLSLLPHWCDSYVSPTLSYRPGLEKHGCLLTASGTWILYVVQLKLLERSCSTTHNLCTGVALLLFLDDHCNMSRNPDARSIWILPMFLQIGGHKHIRPFTQWHDGILNIEVHNVLVR